MNFSDSDMGNDSVWMFFRALKDSPAAETLKDIHCNYNELDSSRVARECLEIMLNDLKNLKCVEFKGNAFSNKLKAEYFKKFEEAGKNIIFKEQEEEEDEEEEEEEEEQEEEDTQDEDDLIKKLESLKIKDWPY